MSYRVTLIEGDGIGPEVLDAALQIAHAACELSGLNLRIQHGAIGGAARVVGGVVERGEVPDGGWVVGGAGGVHRQAVSGCAGAMRPARLAECSQSVAGWPA